MQFWRVRLHAIPTRHVLFVGMFYTNISLIILITFSECAGLCTSDSEQPNDCAFVHRAETANRERLPPQSARAYGCVIDFVKSAHKSRKLNGCALDTQTHTQKPQTTITAPQSTRITRSRSRVFQLADGVVSIPNSTQIQGQSYLRIAQCSRALES